MKNQHWINRMLRAGCSGALHFVCSDDSEFFNSFHIVISRLRKIDRKMVEFELRGSWFLCWGRSKPIFAIECIFCAPTAQGVISHLVVWLRGIRIFSERTEKRRNGEKKNKSIQRRLCLFIDWMTLLIISRIYLCDRWPRAGIFGVFYEFT